MGKIAAKQPVAAQLALNRHRTTCVEKGRAMIIAGDILLASPSRYLGAAQVAKDNRYITIVWHMAYGIKATTRR